MTRPKCPPWLALPPPYRLVSTDSVTTADGSESVVATVDSWRRTAACPDCGRNARTVTNHYSRVLADLSIANRPVVLRVRVRRFFCRNRRCPRRVFCERLPDLATPHAQRTDRLKQQQVRVGLALGGRPGARFAGSQGQPVSFKTLLRDIRATPDPELPTPRCLGVDDWAFRKGRRYGTILVDLEAHRPIDLLPDRTAESLAAWLQSHPGVEVISRDRAGAYAEGARIGAPEALQVADRFHLAKNLGDAMERLLNRHRTALREALKAVRTEETKPEDVDGASVAVKADVPIADVPIADGSAPTHDHETWQSRCEEERRLRRAWRYGRYEEIKAHRGNGLNIAQIARIMHMERKTVSKFVKADVFPERKQHAPRGSVLDAFQSEIDQRWASGCHNAVLILQYLQANGYTGGYTIVKDYLQRLRWSGVPPSADRRSTQPGGEPDRCSPRRAAAIVLKKSKDRSVWEGQLLEEIDQRCDPFRVFHALTDRFLSLLRAPKDKRSAAGFAEWMEDATKSTVPGMRRFANGLEQDRAAVEAAMALPWSNGPVEGEVGRLKVIKRQMYGRANFDLLRRRVLYT